MLYFMALYYYCQTKQSTHMVIKIIDWVGRIFTVQQLSVYLGGGLSTLQENELKRLENAKADYVRRGFSEQKAKVYALYELNYIETNPETVCQATGIK